MRGFADGGILPSTPGEPENQRQIPVVTGMRVASFTVSLEKINPAIWWMLGVVRGDLLHDACGVNGEYQ